MLHTFPFSTRLSYHIMRLGSSLKMKTKNVSCLVFYTY